MKRPIPALLTAVLLAVFLAAPALAKVDLVTLPTRDSVQVTIYNSADLTLVRENRALTLKSGANRLQFSWAGTLIDPTSLEILPLADSGSIHLEDLTFPPRVRNLGLWNFKSEISGQAPFEISYLTSGLSWRAFYLGTLTEDETKMRLQGYVRVTNQSGEDYENAQVRLIVGKVNLLDRIAELAQREYPYGRPEAFPPPMPQMADEAEYEEKADYRMRAKSVMAMAPSRPKEIEKEGLSEYFLYTIEGTETIPHGWSKRLPSFEAGAVPVVNLYKFEPQRYGLQVRRYLSFKNDESHNLGQTPIPGGSLMVFRTVDRQGGLTFEGASHFQYIPVGQDVELFLGVSSEVTVEPLLMDFKTENYLFDEDGDVSGWDEVREFKVTVNNTRPVAVNVEIKDSFDTEYWEMENRGDFGEYEKVDVNTVKYSLKLPARSKKEFTCILTTRHGRRAQ